MPTYDYQCDGCGHTFEEWQSFKDDPLTKCPACKKKKLRRLFGGGAAIIFKGSGFYETDYRRKDEAQKNGKSENAETAKPEAKPEAAKTGESTASASSDAADGAKKPAKGKKSGA